MWHNCSYLTSGLHNQLAFKSLCCVVLMLVHEHVSENLCWCERWSASWSVCQVLIKPKPVFQAAVVSEQTRQLVTETLQQVTRAADPGQGHTASTDGPGKEESGGDGSHGSAQGSHLSLHQYELAAQLWFNSNFSWNKPSHHYSIRTSACSARVVLQGAGLDWTGSCNRIEPHYNLPGGLCWGIPVSHIHHQSSAGAAANNRWAVLLMKYSELQNLFDRTRGSSRCWAQDCWAHHTHQQIFHKQKELQWWAIASFWEHGRRLIDWKINLQQNGFKWKKNLFLLFFTSKLWKVCLNLQQNGFKWKIDRW